MLILDSTKRTATSFQQHQALENRPLKKCKDLAPIVMKSLGSFNPTAACLSVSVAMTCLALTPIGSRLSGLLANGAIAAGVGSTAVFSLGSTLAGFGLCGCSLTSFITVKDHWKERRQLFFLGCLASLAGSFVYGYTAPIAKGALLSTLSEASAFISSLSNRDHIIDGIGTFLLATTGGIVSGRIGSRWSLR